MGTDSNSTKLSTPPTPLSWIGLVTCGIAAGLQLATAGVGNPTGSCWTGGISVALTVIGLVLAGQGVATRPRSVFVLLIAALTSLLGYFGIREEWDSVRLVPWVMTWVAAVAAIIISLPRTTQRVVVSGIALFHFLGVLSAITSPPPQSWLSLTAWTYIFRPHLFFCYTNNAYQFYSPEPGPASLLWFCIETKDGHKSWFKMPRKPESALDPLAIEFYRRLSITEASNQTYNNGPSPQQLERRRIASYVPHHPKANLQSECRPLNEGARRVVASYARHIAYLYDPNLDQNPESDQVKSIKVYRVLHEMLQQEDFKNKKDPYHPSTYFPYFLGEFDAKGQMTHESYSDPMLYWIVPILRRESITIQPGKSNDVDNYLAQHAGSDPFEDRNP